ncbi:MAG: hypothetical protein KJ558_07965 [Gammaproteobacteria bacterium]|nr:hypothetical protein [Gammaproteobacteria bacterium]MBU1654749.1 hypothetical protein [Gammaproteobacteria bacterium]MBU1961624.1 hypothetical protein [Gammaproteobacteria bacterium]
MKILTKHLIPCILGLLLQSPMAGAYTTEAVSTPIPENDPQLAVGKVHANASGELIQTLEGNVKALEQAIAALERCNSLTGPGAGSLGHARYIECRIGQLDQVRQLKLKTAKDLTTFADKINGTGDALDKAQKDNERHRQGLDTEQRQTEHALKKLKERAQVFASRLPGTGALPPATRMELLRMAKEILSVKHRGALIANAQKNLSHKGKQLAAIKTNIETWEGETRVIAYGYELEAGTLADAIRYAGMEGVPDILISQFDNQAVGHIGTLLKQINDQGNWSGGAEPVPGDDGTPQPPASLIAGAGDTDLVKLVRDFAQEK